MFLTRGDMPHEATWRAWLSSVEGLAPIDAAQSALCRRQQLQCFTPSAGALPRVTQVLARLCTCRLPQACVHACMHRKRAHACRPSALLVASARALQVMVRWRTVPARRSPPICRGHHGNLEGASTLCWQEPAGLMGQHLFTVYVHPGPKYAGYPIGNLFHGREVADRVQVCTHTCNTQQFSTGLSQREHQRLPCMASSAVYSIWQEDAQRLIGTSWPPEGSFFSVAPATVAVCKNPGACQAASGFHMCLHAGECCVWDGGAHTLA